MLFASSTASSGVRNVMSTTIAQHELEALIDSELEAHENGLLLPAKAIHMVADSLPGLGIVAAVLGVVLTMGKLSEPPEVLGMSIGAALVGTFLGVLLCYGFVGPLGRNSEHLAMDELVCLWWRPCARLPASLRSSPVRS